MLYNYNNYSFDIVFNSNDFIIQIEIDDKLYSNIFTFEEIKIINNYFNKMSIIEKLIKYCFDKKENYILNIINSKIIKLEFIHEHELNAIELKLDIFPIRKDLSTNSEIITLRKKINILEHKINILENSILNPIYCNTGCVCFSELNIYSICLIYLYNNPSNLNKNYAYIISDHDIIDVTDFNDKNVLNVYDIINKNYSYFDSFYHYSYNKINKEKILNYNIYNINFELLNLSSIIFYDLDITDDIINNLNDKIIKIIFVKCKINVEKFKDNKIANIFFYMCDIKSFDGFYNMEFLQTIKFISTNTTNINKNFLIKANIVDKYSEYSYIINN